MKIYAGNLAPTTTEDELRAAFTPHGTVDTCRLATDKETNQPRGFGFIEMNKDEEAQAAITALDGTQLGGNAIKVNEAKAKPQVSPAISAGAQG